MFYLKVDADSFVQVWKHVHAVYNEKNKFWLVSQPLTQ